MLKIGMYCGPSTEEWSPKSVDTGVGGSEEMVIYLMKELAALGHQVTVWNRCGEAEGVYDGVTYRNYEDFTPEEAVDILIVWRLPQLYQSVKGVKAGKKYLWLHDTVPQTEVLPYIYIFDKIMVLSNYHRDLYPNIPDEHFFLTRNAVQMEDFEQEVERDPYTIVYGSSYDRGLKEVLTSWSEIKLRVPEAKLRVFYGWQTFDRLAEMRKDEGARMFKEDMEFLMNQEGITHLGRIGHKEVAREYLSAGIWGYPTWWPEISCISAMKAQIGGAVPVVVPTAAVDETVLLGYKTPTDPKAFCAAGEVDRLHTSVWTAKLIDALRDQEATEAVRKVMQPLARKAFGFDTLADEWVKEFER